MGGVIDNILGVIVSVNVQINLDPRFLFCGAHAYDAARAKFVVNLPASPLAAADL